MSGEDFIRFCQHLPQFLEADVQEKSLGREYPTGQLTTEYGTVTLFFVHYPSFEKAKRAWRRRARRVDYQNLRIIFHQSPSALTEELLKDFEALPYQHKVLISGGIDQKKYPHGYNLPIYQTDCQATIDQRRHPYSIKRYMDAFDWVSFLNGTWRPRN